MDQSGGTGVADSGNFEAFVASSWPRLVRTAYLLAGDWGDAEDLVQTALTRCYRRWSRVVEGGAELSYVRRSIVNAYISAGRRRRFRELVIFPLPERAETADATRGVDERDLLWRALRRLSPRTRTAVVLRHYADLSEQQTAEAMSCSAGNVKRLTADGLRQLRAYYDAVGARPAAHRTLLRGGPR